MTITPVSQVYSIASCEVSFLSVKIWMPANASLPACTIVEHRVPIRIKIFSFGEYILVNLCMECNMDFDGSWFLAYFVI